VKKNPCTLYSALCLSAWYCTLLSPMHSPYLFFRDPWIYLPCACWLSDSIVANAATVGYSIYLDNSRAHCQMGVHYDEARVGYYTGMIPCNMYHKIISYPSPRYLACGTIHLNLTAMPESFMLPPLFVHRRKRPRSLGKYGVSRCGKTSLNSND